MHPVPCIMSRAGISKDIVEISAQVRYYILFRVVCGDLDKVYYKYGNEYGRHFRLGWPNYTDSSRYHEESWERLAEKEGRSLPPDYFKESFGMRNENIRVFKERVKKQKKKRK